MKPEVIALVVEKILAVDQMDTQKPIWILVCDRLESYLTWPRRTDFSFKTLGDLQKAIQAYATDMTDDRVCSMSVTIGAKQEIKQPMKWSRKSARSNCNSRLIDNGVPTSSSLNAS